MANRYPSPVETALDVNGDSISGATLTFYASGTVNLANTYSDDDLTIANTNPVVADSAGRFGSIFLQAIDYKVVLKDGAGGVIWTRDPVRNHVSGELVTADGSTTARTLAKRFAEKFNPLDHGCVFDGVTEEAAAFQTMVDLAEAAAPSIIEMPVGTTVWGSTVTVDTSLVALVGQGPYQTIIEGNFAAGDILYAGNSTVEKQGFNLEKFRIASSVSKSSGAGLHCENLTRSRIFGVIADGQDGNGNLYHGFEFEKVDAVILDGFEANAQQDGLRVSGGLSGPRADLFINNGKIAGCAIGLHCGGGFGGLIVGSGVDIISNDVNVRISQDIVAVANREVFLNGSILDSSAVGANLEIDDTLKINALGIWLSSAATYGIRNVSGNSTIALTGHIFNNTTAGLHIEAGAPEITIGASDWRSNGADISSDLSWSGLYLSSSARLGSNAENVDWSVIQPRPGQIFDIVVADDAAVFFTPAIKTGLVYIDEQDGDRFALTRFRANSGASGAADISSHANFDVTTGALSGTTGTDTRATVAAHTDEKIYIENRLGASHRFRVALQ